MPEVIQIQPKLSVFLGSNYVAKLFEVARRTVRRQPHYLAFVAVVRKAEELGRRGVNDAGRVRILDTAEHVYRVAVPRAPHGRNEIAEAVDRQQRRALKRRNKKTTSKMRPMMF